MAAITVSVLAPTARPFDVPAGVALTAPSSTKSPRRARLDATCEGDHPGEPPLRRRTGPLVGRARGAHILAQRIDEACYMASVIRSNRSSGEAQSQQGDVMAVGPVDVYIIGFPGNKFTGRIAPAIVELVENGTIRVLDLLFVMKDADGAVTTLEAADIDEDGPAFLAIDVAQPGALGPEDAEEVSDDLPANSSALLVAFENLWAAKLVDAFQAADAVVIDSIRIPVDVVEAALAAG
jgi:hypothetical protein